MWYFLSFILGAIIGSFLNVVIYRLPREGLKLWDPPYSFCPSCGRRLSWKDNIPIISYLVLRGKCKYCGARISPRYLLVELLNASFYPILLALSNGLEVLLMWGVFSCLLTIAFMDLETWHIHDFLLISLLIFSILLGVIRGNLIEGGLSSLLGFGLFFLLYKLKKGMGFGDVLMAGATGFYMDLFVYDISLLIAACSGLIYSLIKYKGLKLKETIPFGPFLSIGFVAGLILSSWR